MTYPIRIRGETPVFLCEWDGGETVEIHTSESLRECYRKTNIFDPDNDSWAWEIQRLMTFDQLLAHLEREALDKGRTFANDNMTIQRIH